MKVVLLTDVRKIGRKYDVATVSDGYALNFLIPQKKAVVADSGKIKWAEEQKKTDISSKEIQANLLSKNLDAIKSAVVTFKEKVNEKGHLFAGLHQKEIAEALHAQAQVEISPDMIVLDKAIKEVGEHKIAVEAGDVKAEFTLVVEAK